MGKMGKSLRSISMILVISVFVLSGCVSSTLDLADRGNIKIPAKMMTEMNEKGMAQSSPVLVRIFKKESELELWKKDKTGRYALLKTYPICRWSGQLGPKTNQGDRQAPEGFYTVSVGRLNPKSQYFLSFDLGYPNKLEAAKGYTGSALMVHGACSSSGCFAISDEHVGELYSIVRDALRGGQSEFQVQSYPFRMTPNNLAIYRDNPNFDFWMDLKQGYDRFEVLRQPPKFSFCEGRYRFGEAVGDANFDDPMAACPQFEIAAKAVTEKTAGDIEMMEQIISQGNVMSYAYSDGGMHFDFRKILSTKGPEYLSKRTSASTVPVSRPKSALADPFTPAKN